MRARRLTGILGALMLAGLAAGPSAAADTLLLGNGDHLTGALELSDLSMVTAGGPVRLAPAAVWRVSFGRIGGDVVTMRSGSEITGLVAEGAFRIRLPSGQTVIVRREQVAEILLTLR